MLPRAATLACALMLAWVAAGCGGDALPPARDGSVVIWAVGDGGVDNDASRAVAGLIERDDPSRVLYLGDVYETGSPEEFATFADVFGPLVKRTWPTPGNHEWPAHADGYDPFWRKTLGRELPHAYSRTVAGWKLISANSQTPDDPAQLRWLRDQTAGGGTCRIAFWHRPRFNAGEHRDEQRDVAAMWNAVKGRAAILLSGHDHDMQRFRPIDGTVQYVSGAGGKSHYAVDRSDPRLAFSDSRADGALRIALRPGSADLRFVSTAGDVLDRSTVRCRG